MSTKKLPATLLAAVCLLATTGFAQAPDPGKESPPQWKEYRIGPEDMLTISVWRNEDLTRSVQVRPDGKISLVLVNDIQAAGLTPMELRNVIQEKLAEFVDSPEVSVIVDEAHSFRISILGKVQAPGRYELRAATTVLDALAMAGGFLRDDFSSPDEIIVLRPQGSKMQRIPIKYKEAISATGGSVNLYVRANDIIVVR